MLFCMRDEFAVLRCMRRIGLYVHACGGALLTEANPLVCTFSYPCTCVQGTPFLAGKKAWMS